MRGSGSKKCLRAGDCVATGILATLVEIFKAGQAGQTVPLAAQLAPAVLSLPDTPGVAASSLARRLLAKLVTRAALALLPSQATARRFQQRSAFPDAMTHQHTAAGAGLDSSGAAAAVDAAARLAGAGASAWLAQPRTADGDAASGPAAAQPFGDVDGASSLEDAEIPDEAEEMTGFLLQALQDSDTVVRFAQIRPAPPAACFESLVVCVATLAAADLMKQGLHTAAGCST